MRTQYVFLIGLLALPAVMAGCGGGGSSIGGAATGGNGSGTGGTSTGTTISGVASLGVIKGGTVNVYAPPASGDLSGKILLKTTTTDASGSFSASIGTYSGPVLIEVSGDKVYTDEATGNLSSISAAAPLRAVTVVGTAGASVPVSVTPLTELATRKALNGTILTAAAVSSANALVSNLFQWDIIATRPVDPALPAVNAATQAQRDYTLALAAISELTASAGSLDLALAPLYNDLSATNRLSPASVAGFQTALAGFLADSAHNQTGITVKSPALADAGKFTGVLNLATQGVNSAPITSLQATLTLPSGVVIKKDPSGAAMVALSGVASQAAAPGINYSSPNTLILAIISSPGFGLGQFITITYVAAPGTTPVASDFTIASSKVTGFDGLNDFEIADSIVPLLP